MVIEIKGEVFKAGVSKKTGKKFYGLLVDRPDGQRDTITIFSDKDYKAGQKVALKADVFIQMANEVV
jgi:hypothetical protein